MTTRTGTSSRLNPLRCHPAIPLGTTDLSCGFYPALARLVQSEKFVESHGGKPGDFSIYGQESNSTTRHLATMNLAIRGIEPDIGREHADTFRRDLLTAHSRN